MEQKMFCYQCEQTVGCSACTGAAGVCGKKADTAKLQDKLTGALIGLARALDGDPGLATAQTNELVIESLFMTLTNVNFDNDSIQAQIDRVHREQSGLVPQCAACASPCGKNEDYDMNQLWQAEENIRSLKSLLLFGLRGMAAYAYHAMVLGYTDETVNLFFREALVQIGLELTMDELLPEVLKLGEVNLQCMALLDRANTESFGTPEPTKVSMQIEPGPFIVVTGHDLKDLQLLLEQTKDKGIAVYTHGEMLPAHAYPKLKAYPNLKGNFGTAWQNQQKEFHQIPAPILFTTNCLMPPKPSYADRVFTTEAVGYPGMVHIGADKDFTSLIEKALELGATGVINGAKEDVIAKAQELTGGAGMDLIIETAGTEITTRQAIHMAKKGSTIVLVGYSKSGEMTLPMSLVLDKELTFKTVFRYRHIYPIAIDAVASGKVNVKGIVTNIYDLDDVQRAMDESVHNKADIVKGVIKIHP